VEIRKQNALKEDPTQLKKRTITDFNLTEGRGLIEPGIKVFEETDSNKQRAATGLGNMRIFVCYEEIMKMKKESLSR
jgi:hypothetical protein